MKKITFLLFIILLTGCNQVIENDDTIISLERKVRQLENSIDDLQSIVNQLKSEIDGSFGLEWRVDDLEMKDSDLERRIRNLEYDSY
jgi:hypothetical protein